MYNTACCNSSKKSFSYQFLICLFLFLLAPRLSQAQICDGNLGENIFTSGDFGSGTPNIVSQDPQVAPGFEYTTSPPPQDGFYTITNNTGQWNLFSGWLGIRDNSPDPNGYMMVINASFSPGLFYEQEITGLCENTVYEFSADVINLIETGFNFIKPNISFLIDGVSSFTSGEIPEDEQWKTYGFLFSTDPGQTSVTLSLRNNAPGGIGNDLAIDNITFRPCGPQALILPVEIVDICEDGDPITLDATIIGDQYDTPAFQWQQSFDEGLTWSNLVGENNATYLHSDLSSGFYYYRYLLANEQNNLLNSKCRVVSNTKIVRVVPKLFTVLDTICEGAIYTIGNSEYISSGNYLDSLISSIGCDSIVSLELTVLADPMIQADIQLTPPSCADTDDGSVLLNQISNGTPPYIISLDGTLFSDTGDFSNLSGGEHSLLITDYFGCSFETTLDLDSPSPFSIDLGPDLFIELGESVVLNVITNETIDNFEWSPSELNDCDLDCLQFEWLPLGSNTVSLAATSLNDCIAIDSMFIYVNTDRKVYIPNVFSPNLDGINDRFTIQGTTPKIQEVVSLQVFNRWGDLIFEQTNFQPNDNAEGWDGTFNGESLGPDVFLYFVEVLFLDNVTVQFSGDVSLLR